MSSADKPATKQPRYHRVILSILLITLVFSSLTYSENSAKADATSWWDPSMIISDETFTNSNSMTEQGIKTFIQEKGAKCVSNSSRTCLKDLKVTNQKISANKNGNSGCRAIEAGTNRASWTYIYQVSQACGINPQVLLVNLQKESSGVTSARTSDQWNTAMGAGCPETGCNQADAGFALQVYRSADMLMGYFNNPAKWPRVQAAISGASVSLANGYLDVEKKACGNSSIKISNKATGALYTYTPYTPNTQTVSAFPGMPTNTSCTHRGWLIFGNYMRTWFYERLAGRDRIETAAIVAQSAYTTAPVIYLARQDILVDAQTAGTLKDGPILLVRSSGTVSSAVTQAINNLDPNKTAQIIALGGTTSVSEEVLLAAAQNRSTYRLDGTTRSATARSIADRWVDLHGSPGRVYVVNGGNAEGSIDAAVAGSLTKGPILSLEGSNSAAINDNKNWLSSYSSAVVTAIGGTTSVPEAVINSLTSNQGQRLGGQNRYETSVAIASHAIQTGTGSEILYVTSGLNLADSAVAGVLTDGPLVLTSGPNQAVPQAVLDFAANLRPKTVIAVGGPAMVTDTAMNKIASAW